MAKKRKKKPLLRRLINSADKIFSLHVRKYTQLAYSKCPLCLDRPIQCCFHFVTRKRKSVRWDLRNAVGACHKCNFLENFWSDLSRAWYIKTFGHEQYLQLVEDSKINLVPTVEFLESIISKYKDDGK